MSHVEPAAEPPATREELLHTVGTEVSAFQESTDAFDAAAAATLGVGPTDLRCLGLLVQQIGPATPGVLATRLGLTPGSVTPMLDRLERMGYVERTRDLDDRRKVTIRATDGLLARTAEIYGPLAQDGMRLLERYTDAELRVIIGFLHGGRQLQDTHTHRVSDAR